MQSMDRRGVLATALMRGAHSARKTGKTIAFKCPRHADGTASAWLGDHQWGCSACGFTEHFDTLADVLGVTLPEDDGTGTRKGLSLAEYAERKKLRLATLAKAGVEERVGKYGDAIIAMPYRDAEGNVIRTKVRTRTGTFWDRDGTGTPLYGQDVLARHPKGEPVFLVEGESDCHAGWEWDMCVVGLPGASQWRAEYANLLKGHNVYVWQEPDEGGATMVSSVAKDLSDAKVIRDVRHHDAPVKDLCDLHGMLRDSESLLTVCIDLLASATPIGAESPSVVFDSATGDTLRQLLDEKLMPIDVVPVPLPGWSVLCRGAGGGTGLARSWYVALGGNTGNGKSLVGINCAAHAAAHGHVAAILSLEMVRSEIVTRYMAIATDTPVAKLEQGAAFSAETFRTTAYKLDAIRKETGGHVLVNRRPLSKLTDVTASMRYYAETFGVRLFVVDYLQLITTTGKASVQDRMEEVSHTIRDLTMQLNVCTLALSQFNRETSRMRTERPTAQGLMGASAIENDSHQVLLLDHSRLMRTGAQGDTWLIMDKNRHGALADIPVRWDYSTLRLSARTPTAEDEEKRHGRLTRQGRLP